jgi:hypothetical protein
VAVPPDDETVTGTTPSETTAPVAFWPENVATTNVSEPAAAGTFAIVTVQPDGEPTHDTGTLPTVGAGGLATDRPFTAPSWIEIDCVFGETYTVLLLRRRPLVPVPLAALGISTVNVTLLLSGTLEPPPVGPAFGVTLEPPPEHAAARARAPTEINSQGVLLIALP